MGSQILRTLFLAATARQALASCAHGTFLQPRAEAGAVPISTFGYTGRIGPLNWAALDAVNSACSRGTRQSPIDMVQGSFSLVASSDLAIELPDLTEGTEFENLGSTIEIIGKGGSLSVGGKTFAFQQAHFHLPSEHLDNGTSQAMEMHMVWQSEAQEIAVIGVYIDVVGDAAPAVVQAVPAAPAVEKRGRFSRGQEQQVDRRQSVPAAGTPTVLLETIFSVADAITTPGTKVETPPLIFSELTNLLKAGSFQAYSGSLTTPPCSEGVNWFVATSKMAVSAASFTRVRDIIGFNSRFPQNSLGEPNLLLVASAFNVMGLAV